MNQKVEKVSDERLEEFLSHVGTPIHSSKEFESICRELLAYRRGSGWISVQAMPPKEEGLYQVAWRYPHDSGWRIALTEWGGFGTDDCWEDESIANLISHYKPCVPPTEAVVEKEVKK